MTRFEGYALLWDRVDRAGDVFRTGAFADGAAPLLWQHRGAPVGRVQVATDATGLRVEGYIGQDGITDLVQSGALTGLSVGYRAKRTRQGAWREIVAADWSRSAWSRSRCSKGHGSSGSLTWRLIHISKIGGERTMPSGG